MIKITDGLFIYTTRDKVDIVHPHDRQYVALPRDKVEILYGRQCIRQGKLDED